MLTVKPEGLASTMDEGSSGRGREKAPVREVYRDRKNAGSSAPVP